MSVHCLPSVLFVLSWAYDEHFNLTTSPVPLTFSSHVKSNLVISIRHNYALVILVIITVNAGRPRVVTTRALERAIEGVGVHGRNGFQHEQIARSIKLIKKPKPLCTTVFHKCFAYIYKYTYIYTYLYLHICAVFCVYMFIHTTKAVCCTAVLEFMQSRVHALYLFGRFVIELCNLLQFTRGSRHTPGHTMATTTTATVISIRRLNS